ncbi:hypothetical protein RB599_011243, partial [Gaeumannomyces hyphopodioides]
PLGAILSTPFSAYISDRFGRRWSIIVGSTIMIVGAAMQAASDSIGLFVGARVIIGFGITIALTAGPVLISELVHPRDRVVFTGLYNTSWYLGALLCSWTTYGTFGLPSSAAWRIPTALQAAPAVLQVVFIWMLPESPRWLVYKDRGAEALEVLARYHGNGRADDALVQAEYREIGDALRREKDARKSGLRAFLQTRGNRHRLLIICIIAVAGQWSGNGLVSYYLAKILQSIGIVDQQYQILINACLMTTNYCTAVLAAATMSRVGRRKMFIGGGLGMWLTFSALTIGVAVYNEKASADAGRAALGFIFIYYTMYNVCLNPQFYLYPSEILPYSLRAIGMSVLVFVNKASLFFNQFVNPIGMDNLGWKYYIVYIVWIAIEVVLFYFFFPETLGHSLESAAEIFDGRADDENLEEKGKADGRR